MKQLYTDFLKPSIFPMLFFMTLGSFAQIIPDGDYVIFNDAISETITTDTTAPFEAFMAPLDENDLFQVWTFVHQGEDVYIIENNGSNTTLGINDGWCGQFGDVRAGFAPSDANVEFRVVAAEAEESFVLQIAFTECNFGSVNDPIKAFDVENGAPGAQVQTFDVNATNPNQQFRIVDINSLSTNDFNVNTLNIFYNQNQRNVSLESPDNVKNVKVYDLRGQIVINQNVALLSNNSLNIPFGGKANGLYFIQIEGEATTVTKRVLIY